MKLISLFLSAMLAENIVLTKFLGLCPFLGTSSKEQKALRMGLTVLIVMVLASIITYGIYYLILKPTNTTYLISIMFVFVIALLVQLAIIYLKKYHPNIYKSFGIYLPLITTNCAVLGVTLLNINNNYSFLEMLIYSIGSGLGFVLVIYVFALIREELAKKPICKYFKNYPIAFITISIMALLFARFGGA